MEKKINSGIFKIDSYLKMNKMRKPPQKTSSKLINVGINTDPFLLEEEDKQSHTKLKVRDDVQHVYITNSAPLHGSYSFGEVLGQGSFGTVLAINDKNDDKSYAMKVIPKTIVSEKMKAIRRELQILKMVEHPHIIYLYKVFESNTRIYLLLERCTGELGKLFKNSKPFSEKNTKTVMTQLADVVDFLHKNAIVHRDLKLENILLAENPADEDDDLYIKVTDFGLGIIKGNYDEMLHDRCGTLAYLPPEVINKGSYSHLCDIWSMGVIMYLLLFGKFPFNAINEQDATRTICFEDPDYSICKITKPALHLLNKMLTKEPAQRITAAEVKMHAWVQGEPLDEEKHTNVLEMMKIWRSDMMLPKGNDCDWVSGKFNTKSPVYCPTQIMANTNKNKSLEKDRQIQAAGHHGNRQSIKIPIHHIEFDRARRSTTKDTPPPPHFENPPRNRRDGNRTLFDGTKVNSPLQQKNNTHSNSNKARKS